MIPTCTMPGRHGDILWALPTVRAVAEASGGRADLIVSGKYGSLARLIGDQPYIRSVIVDGTWEVQETAPMTPVTPPSHPGYLDLGYIGWPGPTLVEDIYARAKITVPDLAPLDLDRPWLTALRMVTAPPPRPRVWVGWSEEHFELKCGLLTLLASRFRDVDFWWLRPNDSGSRYDEMDVSYDGYTVDNGADWRHSIFGPHVFPVRAGWESTAAYGANSTVFLGCLSAQWVLANALGKPTVICEPAPARHHPVFWRASPRNHLVLGGDGKPTFDARHVGDVLQEVLRCA